jgi:hypothetical protein
MLHLRRLEADRIKIRPLTFHVFDGASRIVIEAQSEEDALYLCSETGWKLICACEAW